MKIGGSKIIFFLVLLFSLSLFLHFLNLSYPQSVVFDEQWYASHSASYFSNKYYFDVHPPLGKLLIAFSGYIFGFKKPPKESGFNFRHGDTYPSIKTYLPFRFLPAFLGSLLPILGWLIVKELGGSKRASLLAATFLLFDNALLLQSRLILLEIILVFFSLLSMFFYLKFRKQEENTKKWFFFLVFLGLSLGATISVKWTGIIILSIISFLEALRLDDEQINKKKNLLPFLKEKKKKICFLFLGIFILPFLVYVFCFYIHFSLIFLPRDLKDTSDPLIYGGQKEEKFTTPEIFYYECPKGNFFEKFIKTQKRMLAVVELESSHPYNSYWWEWPFSQKPILYYWQNNSRLYLIGNPVAWFFSFLGVFMFFLIPLYKKKNRLQIKSPIFFKNPLILYFYLISWLSFASLSRITFLYYYLTPLCFSIIIFSLCFDFYTQKIPENKRKILLFSLIAICFLSFLFYLPFTYGMPLSERAISFRLFFPFWK